MIALNSIYFDESDAWRLNYKTADGFLLLRRRGEERVEHFTRVEHGQRNRRLETPSGQERLALTHKELADLLGISEDTLDRRQQAGLIRPSRALAVRRYSLEEVRRYLKETRSGLVLPYIEPEEKSFGLERREVARLLGVHVSSVDDLAKRGLLHRFSKHARPLYSMGEVKRFLRDTL